MERVRQIAGQNRNQKSIFAAIGMRDTIPLAAWWPPANGPASAKIGFITEPLPKGD